MSEYDKFDSSSPNQGGSDSPHRAPFAEAPKTPHHSPSPQSPPLAEVLLASVSSGTGVAQICGNRYVSICPVTDTPSPGPAGRAST